MAASTADPPAPSAQAVRSAVPRPPSWRSLAQEQRTARQRRRMRSADLLVAVAWTSVAAAIGLYFISGGWVRTTHDPAGLLTAAGIVAGLAATDLLLVMLVLAARVPLIDRTFGHDKALAAHRRIGKPALYLLLAHAVLLTVGYGLSSATNPVRETWDLLTASTDLFLSYVALGLLIAVVVTSLVAVRRRLRYEVWHVVHLLAYAGVLVAVPHELSAGAVLAAGTPERIFWIALYVLALGAVLVHRVVVPLLTSAEHAMRVERIEWVAKDVVSIHLRGQRLDRLGVRGGQFAVFRFWTASTWWHAHPISFSAAPTPTDLRLTVRVLGDGTDRLSRLPRGTFVSVEGPYGVFSDATRTAPYLAVITAGIGVTPIRALLEDSRLKPGEATVLLRAGDDSQRYLWDEVAAIVDRSGGTVWTMTGHRPRGRASWMSAKALQHQVTLGRVFPRLIESDVYICGPKGWADLVAADCRTAGVSADRIHVERFES
ncbi:MAG: ferredoxin reductase family protein [Amnibacterium sp.]